MAAAAAKSIQLCPTLCDPETAAHQAPPSLGFSRQEHWSGLPFPSPMHECEKCEPTSPSGVSDICNHLLTPPRGEAGILRPEWCMGDGKTSLLGVFGKFSFSNPVCCAQTQLCATLQPHGTCQAPLSMGVPRQEYWSGLPFPYPRNLPDPGIEPTSLASPALAGRFLTMSLRK